MGRALLAGLAALALATAGCGEQAGASGETAGTTRHGQAAAPRPRTVHLTIEANGDLLIHTPVWQRARQLAGGRGYDFAPLLRYVKPYVSRADLAICHVETPMTSIPSSTRRRRSPARSGGLAGMRATPPPTTRSTRGRRASRPPPPRSTARTSATPARSPSPPDGAAR
jgi:hypothetical protein